jgi:hypothetical protein
MHMVCLLPAACCLLAFLQGTERAEPTTPVQDTITGPTSADVVPAPELDSQAKTTR